MPLDGGGNAESVATTVAQTQTPGTYVWVIQYSGDAFYLPWTALQILVIGV